MNLKMGRTTTNVSIESTWQNAKSFSKSFTHISSLCIPRVSGRSCHESFQNMYVITHILKHTQKRKLSLDGGRWWGTMLYVYHIQILWLWINTYHLLQCQSSMAIRRYIILYYLGFIYMRVSINHAKHHDAGVQIPNKTDSLSLVRKYR